MKKYIFSTVLLAVAMGLIITVSSFSKKPSATKVKVMQLTSVESLVGGGMARSRLISSDAQGKLEEQELGHFYSLVGIKFDNIKYNDATIAGKLEGYLNDGWELVSTNSTFGARASSNGNNGDNGIIITRYVLKKVVTE
jgi:hypothetical protein